ncbi:NADH-cytochrome b5 reductase-like [Penaeus vannamei]|uniref:NADH-cytochrome b5 reductase-like n=1 Tax=Penaeus vannamei TaxID=6689 RepID=UPI000F669F89|nr:NADH-cytochrome b5 reductase-like [Penaeus vannamei]
MTNRIADIEDLLPPKPQAPQPRDCCGSGCCPCVHDIYEEDLRRWKKQCKRIREGGLDEAPVEGALQPDKWKEFEIVKIKEIYSDCICYTFKLPEGKNLGLSIGQHLIVKQIKNGRTVIRQYTPISDISEKGSFDVLIKIYPNGKITQLIKDWKVGDNIPWRGPFGNFSYKTNSYKRILMLAAGTGIAPMYQIIKAIVDNDQDETFIKLLYSSKSISNILLREELLTLCQFWNFTMTHYLSDVDDFGMKKYNETMLTRKLTKDDVKNELLQAPLDSTLVLVCGTRSFDKDMVNAAKDAQVQDKDIFKF